MSAERGQVEFQVGALIKRAWELFTANVGVLIGASAVAGLILIAGSMFSFGLISVVLFGPLAYGLTMLVLRIARNEPADFNVLVSGF